MSKIVHVAMTLNILNHRLSNTSIIVHITPLHSIALHYFKQPHDIHSTYIHTTQFGDINGPHLIYYITSYF